MANNLNRASVFIDGAEYFLNNRFSGDLVGACSDNPVQSMSANESAMTKYLFPFLLVGIGGMIGTILRYSVTLATKDISLSIPYNTLISNVAGCFIIGVVTALADQRAFLSSDMRLFLATGICGGFTTLSSLVYELQKLLADKELFIASLYFTATFAGSFIAFFTGMVLIRLLVKG